MGTPDMIVPGSKLEKKVLTVVFSLANNQKRTFEVPLEPNTFMSPSAALYKIIDTQYLSGSHMHINGTFMSLTDSREIKAGDLITVQYNYPGMGEQKPPNFKMSPVD